MIKPLLLVFEPARIWEEIHNAGRGVGFILATFLLPWLVISAVAEGYGLVHWGKWQDIGGLKTFSLQQTVVIECAQVLVLLLVVFVGANMVKAIGETFRGRHTYAQAFAVVAYGLGPLFLLHLLDAFSGINPWVPWGIGILLSIAVLYHGVPQMMRPDPAHALGLYFMSVLLLVVFSALIRYVTAEFLQGNFPKLQTLVTNLAARLPF
jgi:hypothetical protein